MPGNPSTGQLPISPGCFLIPFNDSTVDECGVCNGDGSSCAGSIGSGAAAGIGLGGLIAIIAAVAILALLGLFAGKKGFDYYQSSESAMTDAQENPAHETNENSGTNPFHKEVSLP